MKGNTPATPFVRGSHLLLQKLRPLGMQRVEEPKHLRGGVQVLSASVKRPSKSF